MLSKTATPAHGEFSPPRLFISYSRSDGRAFAEEFERRIAAEGLTSWRDLKSVEGGEDIRPQVLIAIEAVEHLVLVLTRKSLESDWVKREWSHARAQGVKVSPVLGDPALRKDDLQAWARRADIYDIAEPERWAKLVAVLKGPVGTRRVPYMEGHLSASFVDRPVQFERLKELVLDPEADPVGLSTALSGAGGYGKTTLANALCRDPDVRFEFSDGIIRVEIGKERASVLGIVTDVIEKLDPDGRRPGFTDENVAAEHLSQVLGEARVLLVIDDVWRESQLRPFLLGGPNCVRLITTRRPDLLPDRCEAVDVDELRAEESLSLLSWDLPAEAVQPLRPRVAALAGRLEGWAQMLEIANGWLRDSLRRGEALEAALGRFESRLAKRGLTAFDPKDPDARGRAIALCVDASLEDLDETERSRLEELAVIPEDVDAPMKTVARFWERTGGMDEDEAEDLLQRLAALSLLQGLDLGSRTVRLHDNMKWLLRDRIGPERLATAHGAMADAIVEAAGGEWAKLPLDEGYGWRHGLFHLRQAGRDAEADALLMDFAWIKARLASTGAQGLLEAWRPEPDNVDARLVGRAVALSVPALSQGPGQLPAQLWGRLDRFETPGVAELCVQARADFRVLAKAALAGADAAGG